MIMAHVCFKICKNAGYILPIGIIADMLKKCSKPLYRPWVSWKWNGTIPYSIFGSKMYNVCYKQPIYQMNHTCSCGIMVSLVSSKCTNNGTNPFITHGCHRNGMEQHQMRWIYIQLSWIYDSSDLDICLMRLCIM